MQNIRFNYLDLSRFGALATSDITSHHPGLSVLLQSIISYLQCLAFPKSKITIKRKLWMRLMNTLQSVLNVERILV